MNRLKMEVVDAGFGLSVQDPGRPGWRRFGVPAGGWMDSHAAAWANRLLDNPVHLPVVECLLGGAALRVLSSGWIAIAGATGPASRGWESFPVAPGEVIRLNHPKSGVWTYLALPGGVVSARLFHSASTNVRAGLGRMLKVGDRIEGVPSSWDTPRALAGRRVHPSEQRRYDAPAPFPVWRVGGGPSRPGGWVESFFARRWRISPRSDRVGYRLEGDSLKVDLGEMTSEPVLPGTIQIPPSGEPLVVLQDGPTVGGYPKLGMVDPQHLDRFVQTRPGEVCSFVPVESTGH